MSLSNNERVLLNDGGGKFTAIADAFPQVDDPTLWFEFGDLNADGKLDVVTGQGEGNPQLERVYIGTATAPADTVPPKFRAVETITEANAGDTPVIRFAVSDNATTDEGPRLQKAYIKVTTPDSSADVPAVFMGGDLFRAVLPAQSMPGEVSYSACATDLAGNNGCALAKTYTVKGEMTTSTGTGAGGGGTGGGGTSASTGAGTGTGGGASTSAGEGGSGGSSGPDLGDDGGCGCATPGQDNNSSRAAILSGLLGALALVWQRRRRARRARS
jgi:hypothetical protein